MSGFSLILNGTSVSKGTDVDSSVSDEESDYELRLLFPREPPLPTAWERFLQQRSTLLDEALTDSVLTGKLEDIKLFAYSRRSRAGTVHTPISVNARGALLQAASPILEDLLQTRTKTTRSIPTQYCDHDYDGDSDVEDDTCTDGSRTRHESFSFEARDSASDHSPDEDMHDGIVNISANAVFAPHAAARTWQALVRFLYTGQIVFLPLRSRRTLSDLKLPSNRIACSPKSMYRLAAKLQLHELQNLSKRAIMSDLSAENVVQEMFTDFAWRHREILKTEVALFREHTRDPVVRDELKKAIKSAASGQLRQGEVVLLALFDNFLPSS
ncbi:hypothetical protein BC629DRAFT_130392 [Irpex lacteus]|nr:hypothetical protein BC629DRAFT_130392 [Irpex lacteus]